MTGHNQRVFPRIDLKCPISYRDELQENWKLSRLVDFSADGLLMVTDHPVIINSVVNIQLKPDRTKTLRGRGKVVRCVDEGEGIFHVAIKDIHWESTETNIEPEPTNTSSENRTFPRIHAQCPVRFKDENSGRWLIGRMSDFSATGLLMTIDKPLEESSQLTLQVEPGSKKFIPALRGVGKVVRCKPVDSDHFEVAIKMLRIEPPKS